MTDDKKKIIVDEDWKEQAAKEKEKLAKEFDQVTEPDAASPMPEATFPVFLSSLTAEAFMALGDLENPMTKEKKFNRPHAQYVIDLIAMIQEKTAGNRTVDEDKEIESILYTARMRFIDRSKEPAPE